MSKNGMVSVPRDLIDLAVTHLPSDSAAWLELHQVLAQSTEQPQGKPIMLTAVATLVDDDDGGLEPSWLLEGGTAELFAGMTLLVAENAPDLCQEDGSAEVYTHVDPGEVERKTVKRYDRDEVSGHSDVEITVPGLLHHDHGPNLAEALARLAYRVAKFHKLDAPTLADPGEVERLRGENEQLREVIKHSDSNIQRQSLRISNQRAHLAEQDALLRELADAPPAAMEFKLQQKVKAAISDSAEPSTPVERDDLSIHLEMMIGQAEYMLEMAENSSDPDEEDDGSFDECREYITAARAALEPKP